jgi:nitrite transporter NirC
MEKLMFREEYETMAQAAKSKLDFLNQNFTGYFLASMLAGGFVGVGVLLSFTIGGMLNGIACAKIVMGAAFSAALSLVIIAGGELFTGNNMMMAAGMITGRVSIKDTWKVWIVCYIGNWCGSVVLAILYMLSQAGAGATYECMAASAAAKMGAGIIPLLTRGILCNALVCIAVWCGTRCKSESGKLIMVVWCILAFFTCGFEHSVANMTLFNIAIFHTCGQTVSLTGYVYNLVIVTIGNMIGGILLVALPYYVIAKKK